MGDMSENFLNISNLRALFSRVQVAGNVFDPCAGSDVLAVVLRNAPATFVYLASKFNNPELFDFVEFDAADLVHWNSYVTFFPHWVIGAPDLDNKESAEKAWNIACCNAIEGVAFLVENNFLSPSKKSYLYSEPPHRLIFLPNNLVWAVRYTKPRPSTNCVQFVPEFLMS